MNDYTLTVDEVSKRLNKSVRTIHRYKDSGKLTFVVGSTKGNPLLFSRSEVESLARTLYPVPTSSEADFQERLARVERLLALVEQNPLLEHLVNTTRETADRSTWILLAEVLQQLTETEPGKFDRQALGMLLIQLGNSLLSS